MTTPTQTKIFMTGVTGFVGGSVLATIHESHPDFHVIGLIREQSVADKLQAAYPNFTALMGSLSSLSLLTSTAATADFVIHVAGDNIPAVCAMIDGLASSSTDGKPVPKLISVSGPRSLVDIQRPVTGIANPNDHVWSDTVDATKILSLPTDRPHAAADQAIIAHSRAKGVGTMLISPGQLWGRSKGLLKKESHSAMYYSVVQKRGRAFVIGDGSIVWSWCSIRDLGAAIVFLMDQALMDAKSGRVGVNEEGYYFVQAGDVSLGERADAVTKRLDLEEVESIPVGAANQIHPFGWMMWGCGARFRPDRLTELGWSPKDRDWRVLMEEEGGARA